MAKKNKNKTKSQTPDSSTNSSIKDPGIVKSKKKKISKFSNSEYEDPRLHHQRDFNSFSLLVFGNSFFYAPEACIKFSEHFSFSSEDTLNKKFGDYVVRMYQDTFYSFNKYFLICIVLLCIFNFLTFSPIYRLSQG